MKNFATSVGLLLLILPIGTAHAQSNESILDTVIESVDQVYNVDKLEQAKTIRLEEELRIVFPSHDYGSDFHDLTTQRRQYILDIKGERASAEYLTIMGTNNYHGRSIINKGKSLFIDYNSDTFEPQDDVEYLTEFGGTFRSSDVLMAYHLVSNPDQAKYDGTELWLGRDYHKIKLEYPSSPTLNLFVENGTGRIGKMYRTLPNDMRISYTYDNHEIQNGITIATSQSVYAGRPLQIFSFNRKIVLNDRKDRDVFKVEKNVVQEPIRVDQEDMTVDEITDGTHYVGQGEAYSVFTKSPDGLLVLGTLGGFSDRLAAYREQSGDQTRLQYAMVVDHHDTAIAGVEEAVAAGATLLVTADSKSKIETRFADADVPPKIEVVTGKRTIGNVNMISIPTSHASQVLVAYDSDNTYLYQLLHYASLYKNAGNYAKHSAVKLNEALKPYGVQPKVLLSAASRKPEAWEDFVNAVENYDPTVCFRNRRICG